MANVTHQNIADARNNRNNRDEQRKGLDERLENRSPEWTFWPSKKLIFQMRLAERGDRHAPESARRPGSIARASRRFPFAAFG